MTAKGLAQKKSFWLSSRKRTLPPANQLRRCAGSREWCREPLRPIRPIAWECQCEREKKADSKIWLLITNFCHSEPVLSARNLLLPSETADSSRDTAALRNDKVCRVSKQRYNRKREPGAY